MHRQARWILAVVLALLFPTGWPAASAVAQGRITAEAAWGGPLGVGRIEVELPADMLPEVLGADGLGVSEEDGRLLYPALDNPTPSPLMKMLVERSPLTTGGPVRQGVGGLLRDLMNRPPKVKIYFLFRGREPLRLTLQARRANPLTVVPRADPRVHRRLLRAWWRQYTAESGGLLAKRSDYPPLVENYLKAMLARRLNLELPSTPEEESTQARLEQEIGLLLGTEEVRTAMVRERMLGLGSQAESAEQGLPEPIDPPELEIPQAAEDVTIEPIAMRVPVECLYVRFGSFSNFLWLQDTLKQWGGDLGNLVALRGLDHEMSKRMEEQLVLKQTALARVLGPTIISDVAIIGTDLFLREGAAFGLLFHARNNTLLAADFLRRRSERVGRGDGVSQKELTVAGKSVSLLLAPGGRVRSYYVADGDYHLVTTSKRLVERFLQTASPATSLGASREFRHARSVMPLGRDDTVFVYFSEAFFRNMTGPQYRVEIARRLQAAADLELVRLALLASATEDKPGESIEQLIEGGFLPPGFGVRGDGSRAVLADGDAYDSLRGRRGTFLPIPDVPTDRLTRFEVQAYARFAEFYESQWGRLDPMMVGLKRESVAGKRERVVLDVQANPFARKHVEMLSRWIGQPDQTRLAPIPGNLAAFEVELTSGRLFGGLRDFGLPFRIVDGQLMPEGRLRDMLVGYVGTTGELGLLGLLDLRVNSPADAHGYAGSEGRLWRRQFERFTVYSFQGDVLATVTPQLKFTAAQRPAQLRLRVDDVSAARLTPMLNALGYLRTRETSLGNIRLMHALAQQLHVSGPDCKAAAELLLDAKLICPLGGQYEYREGPEGTSWWTSTALEADRGRGLLDLQLPEGYQAPPLNWFRGLDLEATLSDNALSAHVEIEMQLPPAK